MTSDERRLFVARAAWLIIPGLLSGAFTAGVAWATIRAEISSIRNQVSIVDERSKENRDTIVDHRIFEHSDINEERSGIDRE